MAARVHVHDEVRYITDMLWLRVSMLMTKCAWTSSETHINHELNVSDGLVVIDWQRRGLANMKRSAWVRARVKIRVRVRVEVGLRLRLRPLGLG